MSAKIKIAGYEWAAISVAVLFIVVPLAVHPIQALIKGNRDAAADHGPEPWHSYEWATLGVLAFQAWIFHRQAGIAERQRKLMKGQLKTAIKAANAAETAANAALASIDSPYVYLEIGSHFQHEWIMGNDILRVAFRLVNHGKAPAFVAKVTGHVFVGPDVGHEADFPIQPLPKTITTFPTKEAVSIFRYSNGTTPVTHWSDETEIATYDGSGAIMVAHPIARLNNMLIIPPGQNTHGFYNFVSVIPLERPPGPPPIEAICTVYLIGQIIYQGRDDRFMVYNFCYQGHPGGRMTELYGPPYNERKTVYPHQTDHDMPPAS